MKIDLNGKRVVTEILERIKKAGSILILPHISADGDAVGSACALAHLISLLGKKSTICLEEEMPRYLRNWEVEYVRYANQEEIYDLAITVDTADMRRVGARAQLFSMAKNTINIDHHMSNTNFAELNYVIEAAATAEIIYSLYDYAELPMDKTAASFIYTGILTDTGGFRYPNTTANTHKIAAKLIELGVDHPGIVSNVLERQSLAQLHLLASAIPTMEFHYDGKLCIMKISAEMIKETGVSEDDFEGLNAVPRTIDGVTMSVLIKEFRKKTKVSLRSEAAVDVSELAERLGGGGHKNAAGAVMECPFDSVVEKILEQIEEMQLKL